MFRWQSLIVDCNLLLNLNDLPVITSLILCSSKVAKTCDKLWTENISYYCLVLVWLITSTNIKSPGDCTLNFSGWYFQWQVLSKVLSMENNKWVDDFYQLGWIDFLSCPPVASTNKSHELIITFSSLIRN